MNWLNSFILLLGALLAVYVETSVDFFRAWFGAQPDALPAIIVYAALRDSFESVLLTALLGGLWFDSLSSNPLGVSVVSLLAAGIVLHHFRSLLLRGDWFAQFMLGAGASLVCPVISLTVLKFLGASPLLSWGSLWQLLVMTATGGICSPVCFAVFDGLTKAFSYQPKSGPSFRADRQIKRGRA